MAKKFNIKKAILNSGNKYIYAPGDPRAKTEWIDTGSYSLNAVLSGSIKRGFPDNAAIMFCGDPAGGKTYVSLEVCKSFSDHGYFTIYVDSEGDKNEELFAAHGFKGLDEDYRFLKIKTVEDLRIQVTKIIHDYGEYFRSLDLEADYPTRDKIALVIDSISFFTSNRQEENLLKGETKDNLKLNKDLKEFFRDILIDCNVYKIPVILINHVYQSMDMYQSDNAYTNNGKIVSGGMGGRFGASAIVYLEPKRIVEDVKTIDEAKGGATKNSKVVRGTVFSATAAKSRFVNAKSNVQLYVGNKEGFSKIFGLQQFCEGEGGLFTKVTHGSKGSMYQINGKVDENGNPIEVKDYRKMIPELIDDIDTIVKNRFELNATNNSKEIDDMLEEDEKSEGSSDE